ncbi:hypothetical protein [Streptomyces sp. NPDC059209]|uniref:hypothetical protein n=1 Tax=Streptomyces sp. NPDC059209 TaxID=3346769 RepID=UPI00368EB6E5
MGSMPCRLAAADVQDAGLHGEDVRVLRRREGRVAGGLGVRGLGLLGQEPVDRDGGVVGAAPAEVGGWTHTLP